jgi:phage shock protein A
MVQFKNQRDQIGQSSANASARESFNSSPPSIEWSEALKNMDLFDNIDVLDQGKDELLREMLQRLQSDEDMRDSKFAKDFIPKIQNQLDRY